MEKAVTFYKKSSNCVKPLLAAVQIETSFLNFSQTANIPIPVKLVKDQNKKLVRIGEVRNS
ncbi:MAG: hypothetical protein CFE23_16595 [Flavobacterium sp. BFFFF1]|nr:MAG: hypothetical protein CFE23_16595 [Flavobacterium sp. BFFFF1]